LSKYMYRLHGWITVMVLFEISAYYANKYYVNCTVKSADI